MRRLEAVVIKKVSVFTIGFRVHVMLSLEVATIPSDVLLYVIVPVAIHSDPFQLAENKVGFEYVLVAYINVRGVHVMPSVDVIIG